MELERIALKVGKWHVTIHKDFLVLSTEEREVFCYSSGEVKLRSK